MNVAAFEAPGNYFLALFSIVFFTVFLFFPEILGPVIGYGYTRPFPEAAEIIAFELYLIVFAGCFMAMAFLYSKLVNYETTVGYLNTANAKTLLFNHRLQEYIRNYGEEAVKKDRLRFTSNLHDSSGYVFTNIIAVTEAAMSFSSMEQEKIRDTFLLIRNQAKQGLNQTRETLHTIRELEEPLARSIDTIYEMKKIFQEVTGIHVDIESGNIKNDYGAGVNKALTRIIQEAFTNSVRHSQATRILIYFWEFPGYLTMTVTDNGIGAREIVKGIGLAGMEERLADLGGTLNASSPEDGGFRLKVSSPLVGTGISWRN
jgi:signal transduction histidine kinase